VIRPTKPLSGTFAREVADALKDMTGTVWQVRASDEEAAPSLLDQEREAAERLRLEVLETPLVKAAFEAFPDAELVGFGPDEQRSA
jgi:DNA polymerase-3 subunit gamma/tau